MTYKLKINDLIVPTYVYEGNHPNPYVDGNFIIYELIDPIFYRKNENLEFSVLRHDKYKSKVYKLFAKPTIKGQNHYHRNNYLTLHLYDNCKITCNTNRCSAGTIVSKCKVFLKKN